MQKVPLQNIDIGSEGLPLCPRSKVSGDSHHQGIGYNLEQIAGEPFNVLAEHCRNRTIMMRRMTQSIINVSSQQLKWTVDT